MNTTRTHRIRCPHCTASHETVADVRNCADWELYVTSGQADADQRAELAAEARAERYYESGSDSQQAYAQWEAEQDRARSPFDPIWQY